MNRSIKLSAVLSLVMGFVTAQAQMGGQSGPDFSGPMAKLFGENPAFSAGVEVQAKGADAGDMVMPGTIAYLDGKSRFEMDLANLKGASMTPETVEQLKQMGMDKLTTVSIPEKSVVYLIYPGLKAHAETAVTNASKSDKDFEVTITELGKEKIEGHDCVKNKAVVKDKAGKTTEFMVWNATDLKKFPMRIETAQDGMQIVMLFKDVKFTKPDAGLFSPPAGSTKYDSVTALMQQEMAKRMNNLQPPPR